MAWGNRAKKPPEPAPAPAQEPVWQPFAFLGRKPAPPSPSPASVFEGLAKGDGPVLLKKAQLHLEATLKESLKPATATFKRLKTSADNQILLAHTTLAANWDDFESSFRLQQRRNHAMVATKMDEIGRSWKWPEPVRAGSPPPGSDWRLLDRLRERVVPSLPAGMRRSASEGSFLGPLKPGAAGLPLALFRPHGGVGASPPLALAAEEWQADMVRALHRLAGALPPTLPTVTGGGGGPPGWGGKPRSRRGSAAKDKLLGEEGDRSAGAAGLPRNRSAGDVTATATTPMHHRPAPKAVPEDDVASAGSSSGGSTSGGGTSPNTGPLVPWSVLPGVLTALPWLADEVARLKATAAGKQHLARGSAVGDGEVRLVGAAALQAHKRARERAGQQQIAAQQQQQAHPPGPGSIRDDGRHITVVTTASLPWMTGTAVNPLLRAAYLTRGSGRKVTLCVPWLAVSDQVRVYPNAMTFPTPADQEAYVRAWVKDRTGFEPTFKLAFYPGRYAAEKGSILPVGDITASIPDADADIAILEEPEHLTWYHHGRRWTDKFRHVVGIVHTNYLEYTRREAHGGLKSLVLEGVNKWVVGAYCSKVVKLSGAVQDLPRAATCFVHGVGARFLAVGDAKVPLLERMQAAMRPPAPTAAMPLASTSARLSSPQSPPGPPVNPYPKGVYFLGKVLWGKGYTELLAMVKHHVTASAQFLGPPLAVDVYGSGDDLAEVRAASERGSLPITFHGAKDHADSDLHDYKVFVNPSLSDVVATTTAEALAMGKFVVVAEHPSNAFFSTFPNCLTYRSPEEFSAKLNYALVSLPKPLSAGDRHRLTWEAATERLLTVADLSPQHGRRGHQAVLDWAGASLHHGLSGIESLRRLAGAGANTKHAPEGDLAAWTPAADSGGFFDRK